MQQLDRLSEDVAAIKAALKALVPLVSSNSGTESFIEACNRL